MLPGTSLSAWVKVKIKAQSDNSPLCSFTLLPAVRAAYVGLYDLSAVVLGLNYTNVKFGPDFVPCLTLTFFSKNA